mgnify:CR=1 FL=1
MFRWDSHRCRLGHGAQDGEHYQEKLEGGQGKQNKGDEANQGAIRGYSIKVAPGAQENGRPCPGRKLEVAGGGAHNEARESEGIR